MNYVQIHNLGHFFRKKYDLAEFSLGLITKVEHSAIAEWSKNLLLSRPSDTPLSDWINFYYT